MFFSNKHARRKPSGFKPSVEEMEHRLAPSASPWGLDRMPTDQMPTDQITVRMPTDQMPTDQKEGWAVPPTPDKGMADPPTPDKGMADPPGAHTSITDGTLFFRDEKSVGDPTGLNDILITDGTVGDPYSEVTAYDAFRGYEDGMATDFLRDAKSVGDPTGLNEIRGGDADRPGEGMATDYLRDAKSVGDPTGL